MKIDKKYLVLLYSAIASAIVVIVALLTVKMTLINLSYLVVIVIAILVFPISFYEYFEMVRIKKMEDMFPIFLKDLSDSLRAGLTIADAIKTASKSDYHELNDDIKRVSNQLSWGVSFEKVITEMIERVKKSVFMSRGLAILLQAYKSGGDISPIMTSVADSTILLQNVQKDQETSMSEQTAIIYVIQFVFLAIIVVLFKVLIPITVSGGIGGVTFGEQGGLNSVDMDYYKGFFFVTIIIQSICNGLVAGVTKSGSILAGMKHVAIMFAVSLVVFSTFILPKTLQVNAVSERYTVAPGEQFSVVGVVHEDNDIVPNHRVELTVANKTYVGFTDASGEYKITITAPDEKGSYTGAVIVKEDDQVAEATFTFTVR